MERFWKGLLGGLAASAVGLHSLALAQAPPTPPPRPPDLSPPPAAEAPAPVQMGSEGAAATCLSKLIAAGARAEAESAPKPTAEGCGIASPVRLSALTLASGDVVSFPDRPLIDCEFATTLADYVTLIAAPLGEAMLRTKLVAIATGPGYECRSRDHVAGAKISAHGKGLAVDFVAIEFADKRRVLIERQESPDEASYFRALRLAACGWFTTVLGPGADSFHADNMHLDIERHGSDRNARICE